MKFLKSLLFVATALILMVSCQKEYSLEDAGGVALGTLKSDTFGDCLPSSVNGIYKADSTLGTGNYIEVQINLTVGGSYSIVSDTLNGYYFKGVGTSATPGLQTVKLLGNGKPIMAEINDFTISFGGSECFVSVTVVSAATSIAQFTLGGSPGVCTGALPAGIYTQGVVLNSSNTLTVSVNVTVPGAYTFGAVSTNGMLFTSNGTFISTGTQTVTLNGSGTPGSSGAIDVTVSNITSTCTFPITVLPASGGGTGFDWKFSIGTTLYSGTTNDAVLNSALGINTLTISGSPTTGTGSFNLTFINTGGAISSGAYSGTAVSGKIAQFIYTDGTTTFSATPGSGTNLSANLTVFNQAGQVTEGIFSGTANNSAGGNVTITNGTFKAKLP